jgi:DNA (cytosine-5)-methyltransferase 1
MNVDTTEITHVSLCSGYGGIDLGLKRVLPNLRTVAYAEIEAFACENLLARMENGQLDAAPIWSDLKSFPWEQFSGLVDILSGGYPCQPFSAAGKRLGGEDPRHLWPFISSGIQVLRPRLCFFENVEGHITLGLREVIADLEGLGYETAWGIFSAAECGAPHQRKRVFIMAVASSFRGEAGLSGPLAGHEGITGVTHYCGAEDIWPSRPGQPQHAWEPPRVVANAASERAGSGQQLCSEECGQGRALPCELDQSGSGQTQSPLGGDTNGTTSGLDYAKLCVTCDNRTDELRLLGNGVVPATAALAFRTLLDELQRG